MDDCFDDFHEDFDECGFGDDGANGDGLRAESEDGAWSGPSWQDWLVIGPLAESLARDERERERIRSENEEAEDVSWDVVRRKC